MRTLQLQKSNAMEIRFTYRQKKLPLIFATLFMGTIFSVSLIFLVNSSATSDQVIFWIVVSLSGIIFLLGIVGLVYSSISKKVIVMTETFLTGPLHAFTNKKTTVHYAQILEVNEISINSKQEFVIKHAQGVYTIPSDVFVDQKAYHLFTSTLMKRVNSIQNTSRQIHEEHLAKIKN